jgi:integrase
VPKFLNLTQPHTHQEHLVLALVRVELRPPGPGALASPLRPSICAKHLKKRYHYFEEPTPMKKRENGEGSIYRRPDGTWCAGFTVGYDENGKRKRRYLYARTKAGVLEKLNQLRSDARAGFAVEPSRLTVAEFADHWVKNVASQKVRVTTLANYKLLVKLHITPHIGGIRLDRLTPIHLQSWHSTLERAGAFTYQRHAAHVLLKTILTQALKLGLVGRNPLAAVDPPRLPQKELELLNPAQVRQLLAAAVDQPFEALIALAIGTGARQGELFGLQWRDLDLEAGVMTVQRTLIEVNGHHEFGEPKTKRSRRRIDLPRYAVAALKAHRSRQPATPHPATLVFTDESGKPLRRSNFIRRVWHELLKVAKLPRVKFHSLRHSHVTTLLAEGAPLTAVSERVGHSRTSMTTDVYAHAVEGMQRELANRLDRLYG